jgi:hypothetical protein
MKATCGNNGGLVSKEGLVLNHVVVENQRVKLGIQGHTWFNHGIMNQFLHNQCLFHIFTSLLQYN